MAPDAEANPRPAIAAREIPYPFEQEMDARRRRTPGESKAAARTLLSRLRVPPETVEDIAASRSDEWRALVEFGMQVPVCIGWYQRQIRRKYRQQLGFTILLGVILLGTIVALVGLAFEGPDKQSPVLMAQIGLLLSGLLGAAKVLAGSIDFQKHRSGFWEAASKLKDNLYTLEGAWRGKAVSGAALDPAFIDAVRAGVREARKIIAAEQREFFDALASPTRVLELFRSAQDETRGAVVEVKAARAQVLTDLPAAVPAAAPAAPLSAEEPKRSGPA